MFFTLLLTAPSVRFPIIAVALMRTKPTPEKKVAEFNNFLPVLAYDGSKMRQISVQDVLDITMAGTSATLLAKR